MKRKYVYVIYDPLYERVLCVHDKPGMECNSCRDVEKERDCYGLQECRKLIRRNLKLKL